MMQKCTCGAFARDNNIPGVRASLGPGPEGAGVRGTWFLSDSKAKKREKTNRWAGVV